MAQTKGCTRTTKILFFNDPPAFIIANNLRTVFDESF